MYRQGDILLIHADRVPASAQRQGHPVLAEGEATGHLHQVQDDAFVWVDTDRTKYVEVYGTQARLVHEEHGPIALTGPAIYRMVQQREYSPTGLRHVED